MPQKAPDGGEDTRFSDMLRYDIVVKLPQKSTALAEPMYLNKFHANFTIFRHYLGDLAQQVHFQDLLVQGELVPIEVQVCFISSTIFVYLNNFDSVCLCISRPVANYLWSHFGKVRHRRES